MIGASVALGLSEWQSKTSHLMARNQKKEYKEDESPTILFKGTPPSPNNLLPGTTSSRFPKLLSVPPWDPGFQHMGLWELFKI
jgi:hypothetical protein